MSHRIAKTELANGLTVSTVNLPEAGVFTLGPPYETAVYRDLYDEEAKEVVRSEVVGDALAAHERMVEKWSKEGA